MNTTNNKSWFKQFWPWFLIILPMTAVVGATSLLFTALDNKPDMVVDDYYSEGKAINEDRTLLNNAKKRNIGADIKHQDKQLIVKLTGIDSKTPISLSLHHSTLAAKDVSQLLTADAAGNFRFESENELSGKWMLRIDPFDKSWRLQKTIILPTENFSL
ncbi:FixH family protein [Psychromonas ossibalaenae]|uniref:FixH family protein n=1 Tax=Psychromonas ossibalaenae TaxID=444922 RepID=UPI00035C5206|nr:FixH family protein [Psychromonas ossibalaenae]